MKIKKPTHTTKAGMFTYQWFIDEKHSENSYLVITVSNPLPKG